MADLAIYHQMVTIVRDRLQDMIKGGMTLEQVKAARPTRDYDPIYGSTSGNWTTDMFIEAAVRGRIHRPRVVYRAFRQRRESFNIAYRLYKGLSN